MNKKRIEQLAQMFSYITKVNMERSRSIILGTATGRAILANDFTVLYEQQTENLAAIALELVRDDRYQKESTLLTTENIINAMKNLRKCGTDVVLTIPCDKPLQKRLRRQLKNKRKLIIEIKKQNRKNVRRVEYANNIKG